MKKLSILAVLVCMALTLTACVTQDIGEYYAEAQLYLGCGDYETAAELFSQLGEYEDSADYALYCRALQAIEDEEYALARANLTAVASFKSAKRYLAWLDAVEAENKGELEAALPLYEQMGTFMDAHLAAERLQKEIPEAAISKGRELMSKGEYAAAREIFLGLEGYGASEALAKSCTAALNKAAYAAAEQLALDGKLREAMEAFTALGDTLDAAKRAEECLSAIHDQLDEQYENVTLASAPALLEAYAALPEDETAAARAEELTVRFGKNLELMGMDGAVVALGQYPYAESGEEQPVMWRVVKAEGSMLTLLSLQVLDAADAPELVEIHFSEAEAAAVSDVQLPSVADLAGLAELNGTATAYAQAQGAPRDGSYWLRDSLENNLHPVIGASGGLNLPQADQRFGLRPMLTLDLEKLTFTQGAGTQEDPFRVE